MKLHRVLAALLLTAVCTSPISTLRIPASDDYDPFAEPMSVTGRSSSSKSEYTIARSAYRCLPELRPSGPPLVVRRDASASDRSERSFQESFDVNLNVLSAVRRAYKNDALVLAPYPVTVADRKSFVVAWTKVTPTDERPYRCRFEAELGAVDQTLMLTTSEGEIRYLNAQAEPAAIEIGKRSVAFGVEVYQGHEVALEEDYIGSAEGNPSENWRYHFELEMGALGPGNRRGRLSPGKRRHHSPALRPRVKRGLRDLPDRTTIRRPAELFPPPRAFLRYNRSSNSYRG
jgi:hypothetical protein